jgi:hypothetical protein
MNVEIYQQCGEDGLVPGLFVQLWDCEGLVAIYKDSQHNELLGHFPTEDLILLGLMLSYKRKP